MGAQVNKSTSSYPESGVESVCVFGSKGFSEEAFWKQVLHVQDYIPILLSKNASSSRLELDDLFKDPHTRWYLRDVLGVFGGSFGVAHRSSQQLQLVQSSFQGLPSTLPHLRLSYHDSQESTRDDPKGLPLLDLAFTSLRSTQPLRRSLQSKKKLEYNFAPEFYWQMPPHGGQHICVTKKEEALRNDGWDGLYCPQSEVAFFVWAWSWIRGIAWRRQGDYPWLANVVPPVPVNDHEGQRVCSPDADSVPDEDIEDTTWPPRGRTPWEAAFWAGVEDMRAKDAPQDVAFTNFLDDLQGLDLLNKNALSEEDLETLRGEVNLAKDQWKRILKTENAKNDEFARVWLLDDEGKCLNSLTQMIEFALYITKKQKLLFGKALQREPDDLKHRQESVEIDEESLLRNLDDLKYVQDDVRDAEKSLEYIKNEVKSGERLCDATRKKLVSALKRITVFVILSNDRKELKQISGCSNLQEVTKRLSLDVLKALRRLHQLARFPIIPYYWLQLLYKQPLEHAILPVWQSHAYREKIHRTNEWGKREEDKTPKVVLALLSIFPPWIQPDKGISKPATNAEVMPDESPWAPPPHEGPRLEWLCHIQTFMKHLAAPLVDYGFYGSLVGAEQEATGRARALHNIPDSFACAMEDLQAHEDECKSVLKDLQSSSDARLKRCLQFKVPHLLYVAAMDAMLVARTPEDLRRSSIALPDVEEILRKGKGIGPELFMALAKEEAIVIQLAKRRLRRDDIRRPAQVQWVVTGRDPIPIDDPGDWTTRLLIGVIVVLLKEAVEHSIKIATVNNDTPKVVVDVDSEDKSISIANMCDTLDFAAYERGNQKRDLDRWLEYLKDWRLDPMRDPLDGWLTRTLRKGGAR